MQEVNSIHKRLAPLLLLGLLVSFYLSHHHIEVKSNLQIGTSICSFDEVFDCDSVARSDFSELMGMPVAFLGIFYYSVVFLLLVFNKDLAFDAKKKLNSLLFALFSISLVLSLYLAYGSYVTLGKVCIFCSLLYVTNLALYGLMFFYKEQRGSLGAAISFLFQDFLVSLKGLFFILGTVGVAVTLFTFPPVYEKYVLLPRYLNVQGQKIIAELKSQWENGPVEIDENLAKALPGAIIREPSSNASKIFTIVEYADYECPFCQKVAPVLEKLYEENKDRVRLVLLQFPLDNVCNRSIERNFHENSCKLAKSVVCASLDFGKSSLDFHNRVLKDQPFSDEALDVLYKDFQMDGANCPKAEAALKEQIEFALKADIHSTPNIFIEGKRVKFNSFPQVETVLREIVGGK